MQITAKIEPYENKVKDDFSTNNLLPVNYIRWKDDLTEDEFCAKKLDFQKTIYFTAKVIF